MDFVADQPPSLESVAADTVVLVRVTEDDEVGESQVYDVGEVTSTRGDGYDWRAAVRLCGDEECDGGGGRTLENMPLDSLRIFRPLSKLEVSASETLAE